MKINEDVMMLGERVALVPYEKHHVEKYNTWMQNKELQKLTASDPLTLQEEYEMQHLWRNDENKLTFIILDLMQWRDGMKDLFGEENAHHNGVELCSKGITNIKDNDKFEILSSLEQNSMIGDVNLFCCDDSWTKDVEISIMIAEASYRGQGCGTEAAKLIMYYARKYLNTETFIAKIGIDNQASIKMFKKKLEFEEIGKSLVFQEVTLRTSADCITSSVKVNLLSYMERRHFIVLNTLD